VLPLYSEVICCLMKANAPALLLNWVDLIVVLPKQYDIGYRYV